MTETEWLTHRTSRMMLRHLRARTTPRKMRLIGCACCRLCWQALNEYQLQPAVIVAERQADGVATESGLARWRHETRYLRDLVYGTTPNLPTHLRSPNARCITMALYVLLELPPSDDPLQLHEKIEIVANHLSGIYGQIRNLRHQQAELARCIVGNPFRSVAFDSAWRSETAVALATGIYSEHAFDRLPILADALEEASCDHPDVLTHCRNPGLHARGCWVVDGVLGKR